MKQILLSYTHYEKWANDRLLTSILALPEEKQTMEIVSSFPSIQKTCLHIWDASSIWWQRMQHHANDQIVVPSKQFHPSMKDIANGLLQQNETWINWMELQTEESLKGMLTFKTMKGDPFTQPVKDIVLHLNNHGTYHRGQLVTMLRQAGLATIPQVDYILFARG